MIKIFQIKKEYLPALVIGLLFFTGVVYAATHSPCLAPGTYQQATHHSCYSSNANGGATESNYAKVTESAGNKCVKNNAQWDIFIPASTTAEWSAFQTHASNVELSTLNANGSCGTSQCQSITANGSGQGNSYTYYGPGGVVYTTNSNLVSTNPNIPEDWIYAKTLLFDDMRRTSGWHYHTGSYWTSGNGTKNGPTTLFGSYTFTWTTTHSGNTYYLTMSFSYPGNPNNPDDHSCAPCPESQYQNGGVCVDIPEEDSGGVSACDCSNGTIHICFEGPPPSCHDYGYGHANCVAWGCP